MIQLILLLLQVTRQLLTYMQERRLIAEGERRQIQKELLRTAEAAKIALKVREQVGKLHDEEVDDALRGDYRD